LAKTNKLVGSNFLILIAWISSIIKSFRLEGLSKNVFGNQKLDT
jgi:hypothetical protein